MSRKELVEGSIEPDVKVLFELDGKSETMEIVGLTFAV